MLYSVSTTADIIKFSEESAEYLQHRENIEKYREFGDAARNGGGEIIIF